MCFVFVVGLTDAAVLRDERHSHLGKVLFLSGVVLPQENVIANDSK